MERLVTMQQLQPWCNKALYILTCVFWGGATAISCRHCRPERCISTALTRPPFFPTPAQRRPSTPSALLPPT